MIKFFFKNQIAISVLISGIIISIAIILSNIFIKNQDSKLNEIMNQEKYFTGKEFENQEYILGNTKNKITLLVYSDFECPFCKKFQEETIRPLQEEYKLKNDYSEAKISIVYRHFIAQTYHDKSPTEINAALCVRGIYGQMAYINFINRIYEVTPSNNGLDLSELANIAKYSVDKVKENAKPFEAKDFVECINTQKYNQELVDDYIDGVNSEVDGTPYSLILYNNGKDNIIISKISGARDISYFKKVIDKLIKLN